MRRLAGLRQKERKRYHGMSLLDAECCSPWLLAYPRLATARLAVRGAARSKRAGEKLRRAVGLGRTILKEGRGVWYSVAKELAWSEAGGGGLVDMVQWVVTAATTDGRVVEREVDDE